MSVKELPFEQKELKVKVSNQTNLPTIDFHKLSVIQGDLKTLSETNKAKLCKSILKHGFFVPCFLWKSGEDMFILDATQRYLALKELEKQGYIIPDIPYIEIEAKDKKDAAKKLLQITSRYGEINPETSFFEDFNIELDYINDIEIPELNLAFEDLEDTGDTEEHVKLTDKFIVPPFSIFDTRQGYWQDRKRAWIGLGIQSELGRGEGNMDATVRQKEYNGKKKGLLFKGNITEFDHYRVKEGAQDTSKIQSTSLFDPVLSEIAYKWFCTDKGTILDPFAGGSVRGIVAAYLGYKYFGIDLRAEQIESNEKQWADILGKSDIDNSKQADEEFKEIKISHKWLNHKFICNKEYILSHCHGRCCEGAGKIIISLLPNEVERMVSEGYGVIGGFLQPDTETGKCPFKTKEGLCSVHDTDLKPFGCVASPFTLNDSDTLIIRNRYSLLKCHNEGEHAYVTFKSSLNLLFGEEESTRICNEMQTSNTDFYAKIHTTSYNSLKYLDALKHKTLIGKKGDITWVIGNAENVEEIVGDVQFDFIFSCPPYYNLEIYSDLERELSAAKSYEEFLKQYHTIIAKSVSLLKDNRFACFVVGDIRDEKGFYRNFVSDTISGFHKAGMSLYNEAILVNVVGSLPIRIGAAFGGYRKLGKCHQNVLVFYKGDVSRIKENFTHIEVNGINLNEKTVRNGAN